jgi:GGDEF domain-containing protein
MADPIDHLTSILILENLPLALLALRNGKVEWANQALADFTKSPVQSLIGLNRENTHETPLAWLFEDSEKIRTTGQDGANVWLRRQRLPLAEPDREIQIFTDISHQKRLGKELDRLIHDVDSLETKYPVQGLLNKKTIMHTLDHQVSRSRRYGNPLAALRLSLEFTNPAIDTDLKITEVGRTLKDKLRWADQVGMIDKETFLMILPETPLSAARELAGKLANERTNIGQSSGDWTIRFGVAEWQKGDDLGKLLVRLQIDQDLDNAALLS